MILLVGVRVILLIARPVDDKALIKRALADSVLASREGRPGGVMDKLSDNLKYNDQSVGGSARDIARYIRTSRPDITVENINPVVTGDEATIISPVTLKVNLLGNPLERRLKDVTIIFRKENDKDFLIIPATRWKLAEVRVSSTSVEDLIQP